VFPALIRQSPGRTLKLWQGSPFGCGWLTLSAAFAAAAAVRPGVLAPLNRLWLKLGLLLYRVVTPVIRIHRLRQPVGLVEARDRDVQTVAAVRGYAARAR
jgi:hypothetical protein